MPAAEAPAAERAPPAEPTRETPAAPARAAEARAEQVAPERPAAEPPVEEQAAAAVQEREAAAEPAAAAAESDRSAERGPSQEAASAERDGCAVGQPFADGYCAAKFAVEGLMQSLAPIAARFGVVVSIVEPGAVSSEFVRNVDGVIGQADDAYGELLEAYLRHAAEVFANAQSPADAAETVVRAATTSSPRFRWQTSDYAASFVGLSLADLDGSQVLGLTSTWLD